MKDTTHFKNLLEKELVLLENELATVGEKSDTTPGDWEANRGVSDVDKAEDGEVVDGIEQYEDNRAILFELETKLHEVKSALQKIENGTFGTCEVCGAEIEDDRLEANTSAKTCKVHMNS